MIHTEYDEKLHMKTVKAEGYEEGLSAGREEGFSAGRDEGLSIGRTEERMEGLEAMINTVRRLVGNDFNKIKEVVTNNEHYADVSDDEIRKYLYKD